MKGKIGIALLVASLWLLPRLSHPAVDVGKANPAELVRVTVDETGYSLETDGGFRGRGETLEEAAAALREEAPGEILLDTAKYLLLSGDVRDWEGLSALFRPDCRICRISGETELTQALAWLKAHPPAQTLRILRVEDGTIEELILKEGSGRFVT